MSCKSVTYASDNSILTSGQLVTLYADAANYSASATQSKPAGAPRFKSAEDYLRYKKAQVYAGSTTQQVSVTADIANFGCKS